MTSVLSALINPDSIEHDLYQERIKLLSFLAFIQLSRAKAILFQPLRWFNEYHKENVQLSNKQILFIFIRRLLSIANVKFNSKQTPSIGFIAKEILIHLQEHRNET